VLGAIISPLRHPLVSSKDLGTLDLLSSGRLVVLPTVSRHEDEYRALGVPFRERGAALDEQLEIWRDAWTSSPSSFHGAYYAFDDVGIEPTACRPGAPTLWFGASNLHDAVLRRPVRYGAGFHPLGRPTPVEMTKLEQTLRNSGRSISDLERVGGVRGELTTPDSVAGLSSAIAGAAGQVRDGFSTLCFKPSKFTDDPHGVREVCSRLLSGIAELG
jgi:alkanesulfonate monooxygenase SsuD/methylene tetrahydromethanopterin reductase-like flavin-dependent oxidoreductase (luciferase family)